MNKVKIKEKINNELKIGDIVRILKERKLFAKGQKNYYWKHIYKIIDKKYNQFILQYKKKTKIVLPYMLIKVISTIKNPYIKINKYMNYKKEILEKDLNKKKLLKKLKKKYII